LNQSFTLSHKDAMVVISTIQAELEKQNKGAAIAVADEHGELVALLRTDGCPFSSITIAMNKAYTAARERKESAEVGKASRTENFPTTNYGELRYVTWGGGIPIRYNGVVVGAVGVSGLPETEDIVLAKMGVAALGF
jgi:glc operon protein GlcG